MSMTKRLAAYYSKNEATADAVSALLTNFGLAVVAPRLRVNVQARVAQQERYTTVHVRTAAVLDDDTLHVLRRHVGAPQDALTVVVIDPSVLHGTEVSYGGKKWSSNAKEKLNRFVQLSR